MIEGDTLFDALATIVFNTSFGLFVCGITNDGYIDRYEEDPIFLENKRVTGAFITQGEAAFITYDKNYE